MIHFVQHSISKTLNKQYSENIDISISLDDALTLLSKYKLLALDTETTSVNTLTADLLMLQLGTEVGDQFVFDMRSIAAER